MGLDTRPPWSVVRKSRFENHYSCLISFLWIIQLFPSKPSYMNYLKHLFGLPLQCCALEMRTDVN